MADGAIILYLFRVCKRSNFPFFNLGQRDLNEKNIDSL